MIDEIKKYISSIVYKYIYQKYSKEINIDILEPKNNFGDISIPVFSIAKTLKKSLVQIGDELTEFIFKDKIKESIEEINLIGGFLNLKLNKVLLSEKIIRKLINQDELGYNEIGKDKTIVIDFSSPNIAKPFSIGHLRSTIIGHALANINEKCGYKVIRINHLGDWGTQFGKLIVAYKKWGNKKLIEKDPINELLKLYVHFHEMAELDQNLLDESRDAFVKLENGDKEYLTIWKWFKEESLKEFMDMYKLLGVKFDSFHGESFYNDKMDDAVKKLDNRNLLVQNEGALIVDLGNEIPPALIKKSDGSTLYITRDLAAVLYRKEKYHFDKAMYVVGNEQTLHFQQLKLVLSKMGYDYFDEIYHINFGLVMQNGKKMSTRKGKIVKLNDVIKEAIEIAKKHIEDKNPNLQNKDNIATKIGVSAVIFNDLKNHRTNDVEFNLEHILKFEGQTGPYIQNTSVRIASILSIVNYSKDSEINFSLYNQDHYYEIVKLLDKFETTIIKSADSSDPSILAKYALNLSSLFNKFI